MNTKMSKNGQIVIPKAIRERLGLSFNDELVIEVNESKQIVIEKAPSALDWEKLLQSKEIPSEKIVLDEKGQYDSKKHPDFHDWMVNG